MDVELLGLQIATHVDGLQALAPRLEELAEEATSERERQALTGSAELSVELVRRLRHVLRFVQDED